MNAEKKMKEFKLHLERLEFKVINVKANAHASSEQNKSFPQLSVQFDDYATLQRSGLAYEDDSASDPRYFALTYGIKFESKPEKMMPYDIEVEAVAFLRYVGEEHVGFDRFLAIRLSGYQILYGAMREMVTTITARGRHGVLQLPSRNFSAQAYFEAKRDEERRVTLTNGSTVIAEPSTPSQVEQEAVKEVVEAKGKRIRKRSTSSDDSGASGAG